MITQDKMQDILSARLEKVLYEMQAEYPELYLQTAMNSIAQMEKDVAAILERAIRECHEDEEPEPLDFDDALGRKYGAEDRLAAQLHDAGRGHLVRR